MGLFNCQSSGQGRVSGRPDVPDLNYKDELLIEIYSKWIECTVTHGCTDAEKLNTDFRTSIATSILIYKETFNHIFEPLVKNEAIRIFKSSDQKLKIYNWDKFSFASEREFYTVFQYETESEIKTLFENPMMDSPDLNPNSERIIELHTVATSKGNIYLLIKTEALTPEHIVQKVECVKIEDGNLTRKYPAIETSEGKQGEISISFYRNRLNDMLEEADEMKKGYNKIRFDAESKKLILPIIKNNQLTQEHNQFTVQ